MSREEAIEYNKNLRMYMKLSDKKQPYKFLEENYIALDMAIKALEQEPCIQEKQANADKIDAVYIDGFKAGYSQARFDLEQEPYGDAISREDVLDEINRIGVKAFETYDDYSELFDFVDSLPSVSTEKTWRWIPVSERLPMNDDACCDDDVLISCEDGFVRIGLCMGYDESGNREWCVAGKYSKVMAWMPMPKSYHYKKEGE